MRKAGGNDTFKTEIWADSTIRKICSLRNKFSEATFNNDLVKLHNSKKSAGDYLTYRHMASILAFCYLFEK